MQNITAYTASKIVNEVLVAEGIEKEITPQSMYGKRKAIGTADDGKLIGDNFAEWLKKFVEQAKKGEAAVGERQNYQALAALYMSEPDVEVEESESREDILDPQNDEPEGDEDDDDEDVEPEDERELVGATSEAE